MKKTIEKLKISNEESEEQISGYFAKEVLTFKEALALLGISASTLYKLTHQRAITFYKPNGKLLYFKRADLTNWMLQNKQDSITASTNNFFNNLITRKNEKSN